LNVTEKAHIQGSLGLSQKMLEDYESAAKGFGVVAFASGRTVFAELANLL
jgi:hypothetical protein